MRVENIFAQTKKLTAPTVQSVMQVRITFRRRGNVIFQNLIQEFAPSILALS